MALKGYDDKSINRGLLLDLQFREGAGTVTRDWARPEHVMAFNNAPTWAQLPSGRNYLLLDQTVPDYLSCSGADTADLDFTSEDFSVGCWVSINHIPGSFILYYLAQRGINNIEGWRFYAYMNNVGLFAPGFTVDNNPAGGAAPTIAQEGYFFPNTWHLLIAAKDNWGVRFYIDGIDRTAFTTARDPASSNQPLHIGTSNLLRTSTSDLFRIYRFRVWNRDLSASEVAKLFAMERHLFGV